MLTVNLWDWILLALLLRTTWSILPNDYTAELGAVAGMGILFCLTIIWGIVFIVFDFDITIARSLK